jgi:predicted ester cyclase
MLSAGALLRAEAVLTLPAPALGPDRTAATKTVVGRFYAAVNAALTTGDLAPLKAIVAPDFVAHAPRPGLPPDRDGLERELTALHAAAPGLRLTAANVLADGDQVVAQVTEQHPPTAFLGLPLPSRPVLWGAVDRFRVEGDRIAEHWGTVERGWLEPLARAPLHLVAPTWRTAILERRTIAPGERGDVATAGPRLLVLETGRLTLAVAAASPAVPAPMTTRS